MDNVVLCLGFLGFFVLLFGFILLLRYLNYRETLVLAEKGLARPRRESTTGRAALVWGILIGAVGLALTLGMWPLGWTHFGPRYPLGFGPWMLVGLLPLFFGLALVLIYILTGGTRKAEREAPAGQEVPAAKPAAPGMSLEPAASPSGGFEDQGENEPPVD